MKMLITGSTGNLGSELKKVFPEALTPTHLELDFTIKREVDNYFYRNKPDIIIHCGALTGIPRCEENRLLAYITNVEGTHNLITSCEHLIPKCVFVYISTPCIFYGDEGNYNEYSLPYPKNYYGLTKLLGEVIVYNSNLLWSIYRTNFIARKPYPHTHAFTDRYGTYLFNDDVALAIKDLLTTRIKYGIVHIYGKEKLSMYELAKIISPNVKPMTIKDYRGKHNLTMDMSLTSMKIQPYTLRRKLE